MRLFVTIVGCPTLAMKFHMLKLWATGLAGDGMAIDGLAAVQFCRNFYISFVLAFIGLGYQW